MLRPDLTEIEVVGQVLCVKLKNVWTKGFVAQVDNHCQELVQSIKHQPWAAYIDIRDWIMPSIEALDGFQRIYDWCAQNNQTHEATVCRFDTQKQIIGDVSSYTPEFHYFTQQSAEAVIWLNKQGFEFTLPANFK
ncbi:hypothetical protein [Paraglaciecola hydrolytica]|uniref:STAS/SEC14 domain-containing protein n=1 Tax=Paraglaciecola hydrolytica TaxID=1799789 RepID=A0A148KME8_9ALTE|nr:hypothetical protein [Paraglaciecola hydrolytica]KXI27482.1 hypothetical protein AX660_22495 [Paraglaciecola hydrolytica]